MKRMSFKITLTKYMIFLLFAALPCPAVSKETIDISRPKKQVIDVINNLISLDLKNDDIREVLGEIARKSKIDITLDEGIAGKISISLKDATIDEALKNLCQSSALVYEYLPDRNAYRVVRALALAESRKTGEYKDSNYGKEGNYRGDSFRETNLPKPQYKPGELLVRFKPGVTDEQIETLNRSLGSRVLESIKELRLQKISLKEGLAVDDAIIFYKAADIVEHVEKHALRYPQRAPDDPFFDEQWGLKKIKATEAWDITTGSQNVIVAVIDTGIDYTHPDLRGNIWINTEELTGTAGIDDDGNGYVDDIMGFDFADLDADPMDVDGHGTHVSGIVGAVGNNSIGIAGVNWEVKIMPLKAQRDGVSYFETFAIIKAVRYAIAKGAKIVVCSFGGKERSDNEENAFRELKEAGIIAVCAAGNNGLDSDLSGNKIYPASYNFDNIISVAASDKDDKMAAFSNYGLASVHIMAPGEKIYSTLPVGTATEALIRVETANQTEYQALGMRFAGMTGENGISGILYACGKGYSDEFPAAVAGNIALIERGTRDGSGFYFSEKVLNAQMAKAAGVVIYNNVVDDFDVNGGTLGKRGNWIPAVSVTKQSGAALLGMGNTPVTVINRAVANPYGLKSGTSMAAPHMAGLAALISAQCPASGYAAIRASILNTVDKITEAAGKLVSGGRVNGFAALNNMLPRGDLSGNCKVDLEDAIIAFRLLAGLPPIHLYSCPSCRKPETGDDRIGLPDAIFILQKIAGFR